jgi:hypothetical protein
VDLSLTAALYRQTESIKQAGLSGPQQAFMSFYGDDIRLSVEPILAVFSTMEESLEILHHV